MKQLSFAFAFLYTITAFSQLAPTRKLYRGLNRTSYQNLRPVFSGDGKYIIYLSDMDPLTKDIDMYGCNKAGGDTWKEQKKLHFTINSAKLNLEGAYFISYDGKSMLYTSKKSGGIGKYDIWETKKNGDNWSKPINFGKPLNSASNDGFPSLSPDGKAIYFSRCVTMSKTNCESCKIMMAERGRTMVKAPVALPSNINTGNSIAPLILADNKTLIYSSNKQGGKGGYDLFLTRFENGKWTNPIALDYINSSADEKFVSIPAKGDLAYFSKEIDGFQTLVKAKIPKKFQQRNILWINGKVTAPSLDKVKVQMLNLKTKEKKTISPNNKGEFVLLATAGAKYDISVRDTDGKFTFVSRLDDLTNLTKSLREKWNINLKPLLGERMVLDEVSFKTSTAKLTDESKNDLNRLIFLMKKNPSLKVKVGVHCSKVITDTVNDNKDLTEQYKETVIMEREVFVIDSVMRDSIIVADTTMKMESFEVEKIYFHNDRTPKQAKAILAFLKSKGVPASSIIVKGYGDKQKRLSEADKKKVLVEVGF